MAKAKHEYVVGFKPHRNIVYGATFFWKVTKTRIRMWDNARRMTRWQAKRGAEVLGQHARIYRLVDVTDEVLGKAK